jgi:hypothetical protein
VAISRPADPLEEVHLRVAQATFVTPFELQDFNVDSAGFELPLDRREHALERRRGAFG